MLTDKKVSELLRGAVYLGAGAEGIALRSSHFVIKFWWADDDFSSYDCWKKYESWPQHVKDAVVQLYFCGDINGHPVTVTEFITEPTSPDVLLPDHITAAIRWFCDTFGYNFEDMIAMPNLGTKDGRILLFDVC